VARANPAAKGILLEGHGIFTWGDSSRECYLNTLAIIQRATNWLAEHRTAKPFGGTKHSSIAQPERNEIAARLMPLIRGKITTEQRKVGHFNDSDTVLEFVNSRELEALAALGTSCPDHF